MLEEKPEYQTPYRGTEDKEAEETGFKEGEESKFREEESAPK